VLIFFPTLLRCLIILPVSLCGLFHQPVLSAFEAAPEVVPAGDDEAAKTLHGSYQALYRSMELTFAKQVIGCARLWIGRAFFVTSRE